MKRIFSALALALVTISSLRAEAQQTLYAATGSNGVPGTLFTIDPATAGILTTVGPTVLSAGSAGCSSPTPCPIGLTGLAFHPITGVLYGATAGNPPFATATNPKSLVTIDPATGNATLIAVMSKQVGDIAFAADGTFYGWQTGGGGSLVQINPTTGAQTQIGASGFGITRGNGLSFVGSTLYAAPDAGGDDSLRTVDPGTGGTTIVSVLNNAPFIQPIVMAALAADNSLLTPALYGINTDQGGPPPASANCHLVTIDPATGTVTDIGLLPTNTDALAFSTPQLASNNGPLCEGATLQLTASNVVGATLYSWTGPNSFASTAQNPTIPNVTTAAAGIYSVVVTVGVVAQPPATTNVVITPTLAAPVITQTAGSNPSCAGNSITLDAGAGYTGYLWSTGATTRTITVSPLVTTIYTVTGTNAACTSPLSLGWTQTVNPIPAPPVITQTAGTNPSCAGTSITLDAGAGYTSYAWSTGATTRTITVSPLVATVYTVAGINAGCTSPLSLSWTQTVNPVPTTPVIATLDAAGEGSPNRAASVVLNAGSTYAWAITNGTITSGDGTSQITFTAGTAGTPLTLSVIETNSSGCPSAAGNATVNVLSADSALQFYTVPSCRVADTRADQGFPDPYGPPSIPGNHSQRTFVVEGQCGIPAGARAVSINATVWAPTTRGDLRVFPAGLPAVVSTLNWEANILALANAAVVPLSGAGAITPGAITVQVDGPGTVDLSFDVNGYFQ